MQMKKATLEKNEIDFLIRLLHLININTEAVHSIITKLEQPDDVKRTYEVFRSLEDRHDLDDVKTGFEDD